MPDPSHDHSPTTEAIAQTRLLLQRAKYGIPTAMVIAETMQNPTATVPMAPAFKNNHKLQDVDYQNIMSKIKPNSAVSTAYGLCKSGAKAFKLLNIASATSDALLEGDISSSASIVSSIALGRVGAAVATTGARLACRAHPVGWVVAAASFFGGMGGAYAGDELGEAIGTLANGQKVTLARPITHATYQPNIPHLEIVATPHGVNRAFIFSPNGHSQTLDAWMQQNPTAPLPPLKPGMKHPEWPVISDHVYREIELHPQMANGLKAWAANEMPQHRSASCHAPQTAKTPANPVLQQKIADAIRPCQHALQSAPQTTDHISPQEAANLTKFIKQLPARSVQ